MTISAKLEINIRRYRHLEEKVQRLTQDIIKPDTDEMNILKAAILEEMINAYQDHGGKEAVVEDINTRVIFIHRSSVSIDESVLKEKPFWSEISEEVSQVVFKPEKLADLMNRGRLDKTDVEDAYKEKVSEFIQFKEIDKGTQKFIPVDDKGMTKTSRSPF